MVQTTIDATSSNHKDVVMKPGIQNLPIHQYVPCPQRWGTLIEIKGCFGCKYFINHVRGYHLSCSYLLRTETIVYCRRCKWSINLHCECPHPIRRNRILKYNSRSHCVHFEEQNGQNDKVAENSKATKDALTFIVRHPKPKGEDQ
jgi:hypothetical protein